MFQLSLPLVAGMGHRFTANYSEKEISGLEEIVTETTKIKHTEKKEILKKIRALSRYGTISSGLKVHIFEPSKGWGIFGGYLKK